MKYNTSELISMRDSIEKANKYYDILDGFIESAINDNVTLEAKIKESVIGNEREVYEIMKDVIQNFMQDCFDNMSENEANEWIEKYSKNSKGITL